MSSASPSSSGTVGYACDEATARAVGAAFVRFDAGAKGYLTRHELRCAHIALLGHAPSRTELDAMAPKKALAAGEGELPPRSAAGIELPQLCDFVARKLALQEPDEVVRRAFRCFDDGAKGYISQADLEAAVRRVAPHIAAHTVSLVFSQINAKSDGRVSYRDFHAMMSARPDGRVGATPTAAAAAAAASMASVSSVAAQVPAGRAAAASGIHSAPCCAW